MLCICFCCGAPAATIVDHANLEPGMALRSRDNLSLHQCQHAMFADVVLGLQRVTVHWCTSWLWSNQQRGTD